MRLLSVLSFFSFLYLHWIVHWLKSAYDCLPFSPLNRPWSEASTRSEQTGEYLGWPDVRPLCPEMELVHKGGQEEAVRYRGLHLDNP